MQPQNSRTNRLKGVIWDNPTNHHLWREEAVVTWSLLLLAEDGEGTKNPPKNAAFCNLDDRSVARRHETSGVMENPNNKQRT